MAHFGNLNPYACSSLEDEHLTSAAFRRPSTAFRQRTRPRSTSAALPPPPAEEAMATPSILE
eukprot:6793337-Pyramimonas_sp.AAC.1